LVEFLIKYLGMPLSVGKLPKSALHPLVDKMVDQLPAWKGQVMHHSGWLTVTKMMLAATPVYTAISFQLPPWLLKAMTKIFKSFLWTGTEIVNGGKCPVAWSHVQRPLQLGVLGIMDFKLLAPALRLRCF
jgi:hypothetical protein